MPTYKVTLRRAIVETYISTLEAEDESAAIIGMQDSLFEDSVDREPDDTYLQQKYEVEQVPTD